MNHQTYTFLQPPRDLLFSRGRRTLHCHRVKPAKETGETTHAFPCLVLFDMPISISHIRGLIYTLAWLGHWAAPRIPSVISLLLGAKGSFGHAYERDKSLFTQSRRLVVTHASNGCVSGLCRSTYPSWRQNTMRLAVPSSRTRQCTTRGSARLLELNLNPFISC